MELLENKNHSIKIIEAAYMTASCSAVGPTFYPLYNKTGFLCIQHCKSNSFEQHWAMFDWVTFLIGYARF